MYTCVCVVSIAVVTHLSECLPILNLEQWSLLDVVSSSALYLHFPRIFYDSEDTRRISHTNNEAVKVEEVK